MSSLNKVTLIGNVGKEPEIRTTQDGKYIANFTLATSESWRDKATGEKEVNILNNDFYNMYGQTRQSLSMSMRTTKFSSFAQQVNFEKKISEAYLAVPEVSKTAILIEHKIGFQILDTIIRKHGLGRRFIELHGRERNKYFSTTGTKPTTPREIRLKPREIKKKIRKKTLNILELKPNSCKYPLDHGWCNQATHKNLSYCINHAKICYHTKSWEDL